MQDYEERLMHLITLSKDFDLGQNSILQKHLIYLNNLGYNAKPMRIN